MDKTVKAKFEILIRRKKSELAFREFLKGLFLYIGEGRGKIFVYLLKGF